MEITFKGPGIYLIKNSVNCKIYIGSSINVKKRCNEHVRTLRSGSHHNARLQRAWNKYGADAFEFHLIEIVSSAENLIEREQSWMDAFGAATYGYNIEPTAGSALGSRRSAEWKAAFSAARKGFGKGKKLSPEHRAALLMGKAAQPVSDETKAKMSASAKARTRAPMSEATKAKIGAANRGRCLPPVSEATRKKLSDLAKADWANRKLIEKGI